MTSQGKQVKDDTPSVAKSGDGKTPSGAAPKKEEELV